MMKVLIVDGSKEKRRALVEALGELTNVVIQGAVSDVRSALDAVVESSPDVLVTGVVLPDGDGTHLIERVRKLADGPSIVVIATDPSEEQRIRYLNAGADRYVDSDLGQVQAAVAGLGRVRAAGSIPPHETMRLLGRLTAGVVHDMNNYLGVLDASLELLHRHPEDRGELWPPIRTMMDTIVGLTHTLLDYARGGAPPMETLDLGAVVGNALVIAKRTIPTNIALTLELAGGLRPIRGVRSELEQLLINLVINAVDAMPAGGELGIAVRAATPAAVLLEVADTGNGRVTPPAGICSISTKSGRHGAGLGLGIVHGVVERHRGALRIVDRAGGGTLVAAMFPSEQRVSSQS